MGDNIVETEEHSGGTLSLPTSDGGASVSREEFNVAMDTLKDSLATEVKGMFKEFLEGLKLPTAPLEVVRPTNNVSDAILDKGEASSKQVLVTKAVFGWAADSGKAAVKKLLWKAVVKKLEAVWLKRMFGWNGCETMVALMGKYYSVLGDRQKWLV